jgi:uncharacterized membrane protein
MQNKRLSGLDIFRGYAIVLMVLFHFCFDLNYFKMIHIDMHHDIFWVTSRYFIVILFVFSAGISLKLAHQDTISLQKIKKRVLLLGIASLAVSIGSYVQFPNTWIYFGVLHFMFVSSLLALAFLKVPLLALFTALLIFLGSFMGWFHMHWLYSILQAPLHLPVKYTEDMVKFFPWFGVMLLGISFGGLQLHKKVFEREFFNAPTKINGFFTLLGKNSLVIYLVHQPILFALFLLYKKL